MRRRDVVELIRPFCEPVDIDPDYVQEVVFTVNGWYIQHFDRAELLEVRVTGRWMP